jgi:hypothetical protein
LSFEVAQVDPNTDLTGTNLTYMFWPGFSPEAEHLFQQSWPMRLIVFDERVWDDAADLWYNASYNIDEFTYQSIDDLQDRWDWDHDGNSQSRIYVKNNAITTLVPGSYPRYWRKNSTGLIDSVTSLKIRYSTPPANATFIVDLLARFFNKSNMAEGRINFNTANSTFEIRADLLIIKSGATWTPATLSIAASEFPANTDRWLRFIVAGNTFKTEFWKTNPALGGAASFSTGLMTITGVAAGWIGAGVKGPVGFMANIPKWVSIDDHTVEISDYNDTAFIAHNMGNFRAQPVIELTGPYTNTIITNERNGEQISIPAAIPSGETWVLDIEARRMYRKSDGANRFSYLDINSDWMELEPGENPISLATSGAGAASAISIDFHHTVM